MLGAGFIAEFRAQVYARLEGVDVVSVLGRTEERTRAFAARVGIGHAATTWDALLAGPSFDAVDLCLPSPATPVTSTAWCSTCSATR